MPGRVDGTGTTIDPPKKLPYMGVTVGAQELKLPRHRRLRVRRN
jgi:hypothetical protein